MLVIQQAPAYAASTSLQAASESSVQQAAFMRMVLSPDRYAFRDWRSYAYEMALRRSIVNAAAGLNASGASFAVDRDSRCNPAYWQRTHYGGFRLLPSVVPADAVRDIFVNGSLYAFECASAIVIVYYKAVLDTFTDDTFNRMFANMYLYHWNYDMDLRLTNLPVPGFLPGDVLYFRNPDVNPNTPEWQGENAVDMGGGLYFGHGIGITTADRIIFHLNNHRAPGAQRSAYLMETAVRPDFRYLSQFAAPAVVGLREGQETAEALSRLVYGAQVGSVVTIGANFSSP